MPHKFASLVVLDDLESLRVDHVYHAGQLVYSDGEILEFESHLRKPQMLRSSINVHWLETKDFAVTVPSPGEYDIHVIEVMEDRIDTGHTLERMRADGQQLHADPKRDLCKLAVIERHMASGNIGLGFARGFGFSSGAIASSVGHDSHNLLVAGTNDHDMYTAAVHVVKTRGGFCVVKNGQVLAEVPLPIAGLMSDIDAKTLSGQTAQAARSRASARRQATPAVHGIVVPEPVGYRQAQNHGQRIGGRRPLRVDRLGRAPRLASTNIILGGQAMIQVYTAAEPEEAHMIKAFLENNGIKAVVQGDNLWATRGDLPPLGPGGAPSVSVDEADAEKARELIEQQQQHELPAGPMWTCGGCGQRLSGRFTQCWKCGREQPERED